MDEGSIKAKVPGTHESHKTAPIRSEDAWRDQSGVSRHGAEWTKAKYNFVRKKAWTWAQIQSEERGKGRWQSKPPEFWLKMVLASLTEMGRELEGKLQPGCKDAQEPG